MTAPRRLLFVHAHPDDETLTTGVTMAHYARGGHEVHLLTCTLGEEGEVIPEELADHVSARDDTLGLLRREELREAMRRLGVQHEILGADRATGLTSRWRDSGMAGSASSARKDAFANADIKDAAKLVAAHVRRLRPDVVVTYDPEGGYGHPDHVKTHDVVMRALSRLTEDEQPMYTYWIVTPQSWARKDRRWLASHVPRDSGIAVLDQDGSYPASVWPDELVTHTVADDSVVPLVQRALDAHRTQVLVGDRWYALSNRVAGRISRREGYVEVDLATGRPKQRPEGSRQAGLLGPVAERASWGSKRR